MLDSFTLSSSLDEINLKNENSIPLDNLVFDPTFISIKIEFPKKYENILKGVSEIPFLYELKHTNVIKIIDLTKRSIIGEIETECFGDLNNKKYNGGYLMGSNTTDRNSSKKAIKADQDVLNTFDQPVSSQTESRNIHDKSAIGQSTIDRPAFSQTSIKSKIYFVFGKDVFKAKCKIESNKRYKDSVRSNVKFVDSFEYKKIKENYLILQIEKLINFVFIENSEHLHSQLKSFVSILRQDDQFVPKTKKFNENKKKDFMKNLLKMIAGVSESIASTIAEAYSSFEELEKALIEKDRFLNLRIVNETRGIPEKIHKKIYKALISEKENERL
jgi:hypothetical protein